MRSGEREREREREREKREREREREREKLIAGLRSSKFVFGASVPWFVAFLLASFFLSFFLFCFCFLFLFVCLFLFCFCLSRFFKKNGRGVVI